MKYLYDYTKYESNESFRNKLITLIISLSTSLISVASNSNISDTSIKKESNINFKHQINTIIDTVKKNTSDINTIQALEYLKSDELSKSKFINKYSHIIINNGLESEYEDKFDKLTQMKKDFGIIIGSDLGGKTSIDLSLPYITSATIINNGDTWEIGPTLFPSLVYDYNKKKLEIKMGGGVKIESSNFIYIIDIVNKFVGIGIKF